MIKKRSLIYIFLILISSTIFYFGKTDTLSNDEMFINITSFGKSREVILELDGESRDSFVYLSNSDEGWLLLNDDEGKSQFHKNFENYFFEEIIVEHNKKITHFKVREMMILSGRKISILFK